MDKKIKAMVNNMDMVINHGDKIGFNSIRNQVAEKVINVDKAQNAALDKNEKVDSAQEKALKEAAKVNAAQEKALKENEQVDAAQEKAIGKNTDAIKAEEERAMGVENAILEELRAEEQTREEQVSALTKSIQDEQAAREEEAKRAQAAEETLTSYIQDEQKAREAVAAELTKEEQTREDAIKTVVGYINDEITDRKQDVKNLTEALERDAANLADVQNNLFANITGVQKSLTEAISAEGSERKTEDDKLSDAITDEVTRATQMEAQLEATLQTEGERIDLALQKHDLDIDGLKSSAATVHDEIKKQVAEDIAKIIDNAPETFDTLKEIAEWIGEDTTTAPEIVANVAKAQETADKAVNDAANALASAKDYANSLAVNYDAAGAADKALEDANAYTDEATRLMVGYTDTSAQRGGNSKSIILNNHDNIIGKGNEDLGGEFNLAMVSKWNVADFGSASIHMNLNSLNGEVTINDNNPKLTGYGFVAKSTKGDFYADTEINALSDRVDDIEASAAEAKEFVLLKSPLGKVFKLSVDEEGNLVTEPNE